MITDAINKLFRRKRLTVGMIGLGNISDIHLQAYKKRNEIHIKALSDVDADRLRRKGNELNISEQYPDYRTMLADKDVDVVDIMTPHYLHAQCVCDALKAGKIVICEKPLATTIKDVDNIIATSRRTRKNVYVKQYLRYSQAYERIRQLLENHEIGTPYFIQCTFTSHSVKDYADPKTWRGNTREAGGGVFIDIGIHIIDILHELFANPIATYAQFRNIGKRLPSKGEDFAAVLMEFPHNLMVNIVCTENDVGYRFRWEIKIFGTNGILHLYDKWKKEKVLHLLRENHIVYEFIERDWWQQANFRALWDILDRIQLGRGPLVTLPQARSVLNAIIESYRSAKTGRKIYLYRK